MPALLALSTGALPSSDNGTIMGTPMLKGIAGRALIWLGILGAAVTLFANVRSPLDMADWAWWIVEKWQEATPTFWNLALTPTGLDLHAFLVPPLNIAAFLLLIAIGVRLRDHSLRKPAVVHKPSYHLVGGIAVLAIIGYIGIAVPSSASDPAGALADAPLVIFLAAATASFSPIAGRGDLIARLWGMLAGLLILLALNELTKIGL